MKKYIGYIPPVFFLSFYLLAGLTGVSMAMVMILIWLACFLIAAVLLQKGIVWGGVFGSFPALHMIYRGGSEVLIGIALRFMSPVPHTNIIRDNPLDSLSYRFVESVEKASVSVMKICAWITLFSCLFSLLKELGLSDNTMSMIRCVLEVTGGCRSAAEYGNIYTVTATLGWSGLCVVCQVLGDVRKVGTPLPLFLAFRAVHAALAAVVCYALLTLFPVSVSTFVPLAPDTAVEVFSASAPAAVALLGLCTVFVVDLDRNKKMC